VKQGRWRLPALIAMAVGLAVLVAMSDDGTQQLPSDAVVRPVVKSKTDSTRPLHTLAKSDETLLALAPRRFDGEIPEIFRVLAPSPLPAAAKVPEGAPSAPPLPFKFIGMIVEDDRVSALVSFQGKDLTIRSGDQIDSNYRVEKVANGEIQFIYLPLQMQQTLSIGEKN